MCAWGPDCGLHTLELGRTAVIRAQLQTSIWKYPEQWYGVGEWLSALQWLSAQVSPPCSELPAPEVSSGCAHPLSDFISVTSVRGRRLLHPCFLDEETDIQRS